VLRGLVGVLVGGWVGAIDTLGGVLDCTEGSVEAWGGAEAGGGDGGGDVQLTTPRPNPKTNIPKTHVTERIDTGIISHSPLKNHHNNHHHDELNRQLDREVSRCIVLVIFRLLHFIYTNNPA
jgi:hypothetical protein